ncbi:alkaline phosphatase D family protein [Ramlibacter sp.]|uniref:alkaline phosphatase D family protein n=1 Tax=Ramlibacter sp. TaxID=1917967 RepID=UPI002C10E303|nr:alkaline phosphatase D family protein [Ramlibacter sp.]HWI82092.1 alkaline phosphatase D family protein [Ramlibacter sp.]
MRSGWRRREWLAAAGALSLAGCGTWPGARQPAGAAVLHRVAFASCTDETRPQPLWDRVLADRPDLMLFGGDNVYASDQPWSRAALERAYALEAAVPEFARLRAAVPHLAIWDDHDYGLNDGGAEFAHKRESKEAFLRFWQVAADDPRRTREGIYHARMFGPPGRRVQVILLDTRWFRSPWKPTDERGKPGKERYLPDADPARTILGEAQWRWLEAQLREPAQLRLLMSGIQVVAEGHGWERWGNFPLERQRLYRLIADTRAGCVVLLSGDRHFGAIYREPAGTAYPLYEVTASGVTHSWRDAAEAGPNRLGAPFGDLHYGMVDIDWAGRAVQLSVKDSQGEAARAQRVAFEELQVRG